MSIVLDIEKRLGDFQLKVQLEAGNEVLALLGASGCGKSMTLKCIAGIERPDKGKIIVDGVTLFDSARRIDLTPQKRRTGLMFQNYALFPNMTVLQNIRTGIHREKNKEAKEAKIAEIMESFGLTELANHYPAQLSGGQQQRTALARILISGPEILLLDEPFSALDSHLRFRLEQEVREVIHSFGKTVVLVSHDRDEVFRLSDKIAVMHRGHVEMFGTRDEVFAKPATQNAAVLTGCKNISKIQRLSENRVLAEDWGVELETSEAVSAAESVGIRMHDVSLAEETSKNTYLCEVVQEIENPFSYTVILKPVGSKTEGAIGWELDKEEWKKIRSGKIRIAIPPESIVLLNH